MSIVKVKPAKQRVVILPDNQPDKVGSLYIPPSAQKDSPRMGTIVSTGIGTADIPMEYHVGERVMFSQYSGVEIELNLGIGVKTYLVMNQLDIMMTIEEVKE